MTTARASTVVSPTARVVPRRSVHNPPACRRPAAHRPLGDESDEAVALALHARHHRAAVDRDVAAEAEARESLDRMGRFRGSDQKLARHAADARARRAVHAALDQQRSPTGRLAAR
jgi:hypothetical protein